MDKSEKYGVLENCFIAFTVIVLLITPLLIQFDRKHNFFLWNTNTNLGGMEKLESFGNTEFISIGQYLVGITLYGIIFHFISVVFFILACIYLEKK